MADIPNEFINIKFQSGPIQEYGANGCQVEDVIEVLVNRLTSYQDGEFPCKENEHAIASLEEASLWIQSRTHKRVEQGVEGKNEAHT